MASAQHVRTQGGRDCPGGHHEPDPRPRQATDTNVAPTARTRRSLGAWAERVTMDDALNPAEDRAVRALQRLARSWPPLALPVRRCR
jgi:hypothetical protein